VVTPGLSLWNGAEARARDVLSGVGKPNTDGGRSEQLRRYSHPVNTRVDNSRLVLQPSSDAAHEGVTGSSVFV